MEGHEADCCDSGIGLSLALNTVSFLLSFRFRLLSTLDWKQYGDRSRCHMDVPNDYQVYRPLLQETNDTRALCLHRTRTIQVPAPCYAILGIVQAVLNNLACLILLGRSRETVPIVLIHHKSNVQGRKWKS
jgi:hypothetical protein